MRHSSHEHIYNETVTQELLSFLFILVEC